MKSIRNFFAVALGAMAALLLAPFITLFGLLMLGLAFGLSLIAAAAATEWSRVHRAGGPIDVEAEPMNGAGAAEQSRRPQGSPA